MTSRKYLYPFIIFIIFFILLWVGLYNSNDNVPLAMINEPVPKFSLASLENNTLVTEQIFNNRISIVNIWSSWCNVCRVEHQMLIDLEKTGKFQLVGINYKDDKKNADLWLNKLGNPYRVNIFDDNGSLGFDLGVYGTPETYIIDHFGIIRYRHVGALTIDIWANEILPMIDKIATIKAKTDNRGV